MLVAPHSLFLLPSISRMVWSSQSLLMRELSRGVTAGDAALEDLPVLVVLCGAMALPELGGFERRTDC
jgi:hypothetical protein